MYVACPFCKSLYSITAEQLTAARGQVRCGQCQARFSAADAVFETPQAALEHAQAKKADVAQEIDALVGRALDQVTGGEAAPMPDASSGSLEPAPQAEAAPTPDPEAPVPEARADAALPETEAALDRRGPASWAARDPYAQPVAAEFTPPPAADEADAMPPELLLHDSLASESPVSWAGIAALLVLGVALVVQYAWWDRNHLAQIDAVRPALEALCRPLACTLPLPHDLARVEMVEREVRNHPDVAHALLVSAAFINRADYRQAYPVLEIAFSDISGTPVAVRRFMPEEYLRGKDPHQGMEPGEQTLVKLEVVDPGEKAVSFQFDFM